MTAGWFLFVAGAILIASGFKNVKVTDLVSGNDTNYGLPAFVPGITQPVNQGVSSVTSGVQSAAGGGGGGSGNAANVTIPGVTPFVGHPAHVGGGNAPPGVPKGFPKGMVHYPLKPKFPSGALQKSTLLHGGAIGNIVGRLGHPAGSPQNPTYKKRTFAHPQRPANRHR
jgi:hypothetical protein